MEQIKDEALLKKARRAVWLNRCLKKNIPKEFEALVIAKKCCNDKFMRRYILKNKLLESNEESFLKTYLNGQNKDDLQLVRDYVFIYGASTQGQILIMQSKNVEVITTLIDCYDYIKVSEDCSVFTEALTELINLKDPKLLYTVLEKLIFNQRTRFGQHYFYPKNVWQTCFKQVIKTDDINMLPVFLNLRFTRGMHFDANNEKFLLENGSKEMISLYTKHFLLFEDTLEYLTSNLQICDKWEKLLSHEIKRQKFPVSALMNLVKYQKHELLKVHFEKYGLPPEVLTFYANQEKFKKDLDIT